MKVKIKQGNEMLDATIEMIDGVMVVSPKKVKFEPKEGEIYFIPCCDVSGFHVRSLYWEGTKVENKYYENGWCFKTKQECQAFCDRLNDAISQVKP